HDAGDLKLLIDGAFESAAIGKTGSVDRRDRRSAIAWILCAGVTAAALAFAVAGRSVVEPRKITRSLMTVTPADMLRSTPVDAAQGGGRPSRTAITFAPDGRTIAFSAVRDNRQQLYLRRLDALDATPLAGTENGNTPFFSPDGQWLGF